MKLPLLKLLTCLVLLLQVFPFCKSRSIKTVNEDIEIELVNSRFNIVVNRNTEDEWRYVDVDSLAINSGELLIYGRSKVGSEKKWFFITGGRKELKKSFGNWSDREFRKKRLHEIDKDRSLYNSLMPTRRIWEKI